MVRISSSRLNMEDGRIDNAVFKHHSETLVGGTSGTNTGSSYSVDLSSGNTFHLILSQTCTFTFSNPPSSGTEGSFTLLLQRGAPGRAIWPSSVRWVGGAAPTLSPVVGQYDIFTFFTADAGTTWFGSIREDIAKPKKLWKWGLGTSGQMGDSAAVSRSVPTQIGSLTEWATMGGIGRNTFAIKANGVLWAWGVNTYGQLGIGTVTSNSSPAQVGSTTDWMSVARGVPSIGDGNPVFHTLATKADGTLWAWGMGNYGGHALNTTAHRSSPTQVGSLTTWKKAVTRRFGGTALKTDGTLWGWGYNAQGQIGDNTTAHKSSPTQIGALTTWSKLESSNAGGRAIKTDGTLWAWGLNSSGQLGVGDAVNRSSPTQVGALTTWTAAFGGEAHTIALKTDGTLWSWGLNSSGQLGDGTAVSRSSPVQIGALTSWSKIEASSRGGFAIKTDGTLWSWGEGANGHTAQDNTTNLSSPTQVGGNTNWLDIFSGGYHTGALASIAPPTYTSLLLHADGSDTSTTFTDSSLSAKTVTANGNVQIDTAQSKFGGASALFDGSGDSISHTSHSDWSFGTGDFTIDFWVRPSSGNIADGRAVLDIGGGLSKYSMRMQDSTTGNGVQVYLAGSIISATTNQLSADTWYHVAHTRSGGTLRLFLDGVLVDTDSNSTSINGNLSIGTLLEGGSGSAMLGWLDEIRISKGIARWTSNFTPPTSAYTAD